MEFGAVISKKRRAAGRFRQAIYRFAQLREFPPVYNSQLQKASAGISWLSGAMFLLAVLMGLMIVVTNILNQGSKVATVTTVLLSIFLAVFIGLTIFFCCLTMNEGIIGQNGIRTISWNDEVLSKNSRRKDIGQNVIAALRSRNATHNADKAFAVQPILCRLADIKIPAPDYLLELKKIYKDLTIQVIQSTESLEPLLLTIQHRFSQFLS